MGAKNSVTDALELQGLQGQGNQARFNPSVTGMEDPQTFVLTEAAHPHKAHAVLDPRECSGPGWAGASD